jgi:uncharacterized integral membrane protein
MSTIWIWNIVGILLIILLIVVIVTLLATVSPESLPARR